MEGIIQEMPFLCGALAFANSSKFDKFSLAFYFVSRSEDLGESPQLNKLTFNVPGAVEGCRDLNPSPEDKRDLRPSLRFFGILPRHPYG